MAFPFAKPGDADYVAQPPDDSVAQNPARETVRPSVSRPAAQSAPRPTNNISPRPIRPFSTTKLVPKAASATDLVKIARTKFARTWGEFFLGNGLSSAFDPSQRGLAVDMAAYSNPVSGTIFGINDTARHLYNGNYGNALGSLGMTALSYLPGGGAAGAGARAAAKSVGVAGAKAVGNTAARGGARGLTNAMAAFGRRSGISAVDDAARGINTFAQQGAKAVNTGQQAITNTLQKVPGLSPAANPATGLKSWASPSAYKDWAVQNPALATSTFMHPAGVNPTGEGMSDINNRLQGEREQMLQRLQQLR